MTPPGLERFKKAQDKPHAGFESALAELRAGRKQGHWIWYVFPQLAGLGRSPMAQTFGIDGVAEAAAYLRDPLLRSRLLTATTTVADQLRNGISLDTLMGSGIDGLKLVSSLTLFEHVARKLAAPEPDEEYAALAKSAAEVLAAVAAQGYSRCQFTLDRLNP